MNPLWRLDAGLQKEILKNKGTLKLGIRDIFAPPEFSGNIKYKEIDVFVKKTTSRQQKRIAYFHLQVWEALAKSGT